ncbi:MAG: hypothetical protein P9X22_00150 [Candidatus Zapsychrus exili]|nr:hypothetical protein [Candidatus Zapsychrus exili]
MHILKNKALTLTELLVSTVLVGIVMIGVVSMNYAIKQVQESTNKSSMLAMRTASTMSYITREGSQAIGDVSSYGIVLNTTNPSTCNWVSFRQDTSDSADDYTDDIWKIFIRDLNTNTLRMCEQTIAQGGSTPNTSSKCSVASSIIISQHIQNVTFELLNNPNQSYLDFYLSIAIDARYTPDSAVNPIENPEYFLQTKISPASHSW